MFTIFSCWARSPLSLFREKWSLSTDVLPFFPSPHIICHSNWLLPLCWSLVWMCLTWIKPSFLCFHTLSHTHTNTSPPVSTKQPGFPWTGTSELLPVPDMQIILPELQYFQDRLYLKNYQLPRISSMQCPAHTTPAVTERILLHISPLKGNAV